MRRLDEEFAVLTRTIGQARRLASIQGIGVINTRALLSAVGDGGAFAKSRDRPGDAAVGDANPATVTRSP